jgi:hypothetical protein
VHIWNYSLYIYIYLFIYLFIYSPWLDTPSGPRLPHCWGSEIAIRCTTLGRIPPDSWPACRRDLYLTTHNTHWRQTSMPPGGIWTCNPSKREATVLSLRKHGHRHLLMWYYLCQFHIIYSVRYSSNRSYWRINTHDRIKNYTWISNTPTCLGAKAQYSGIQAPEDQCW